VFYYAKIRKKPSTMNKREIMLCGATALANKRIVYDDSIFVQVKGNEIWANIFFLILIGRLGLERAVVMAAMYGEEVAVASLDLTETQTKFLNELTLLHNDAGIILEKFSE
jgi:hypothetical protein